MYFTQATLDGLFFKYKKFVSKLELLWIINYNFKSNKKKFKTKTKTFYAECKKKEKKGNFLSLKL